MRRGIVARLALSTVVAIIFLGDGALADAQTTSDTDLAIAALAGRIAVPLEKAKARKVVVADLRGPDGESHPVGGWLADRLSASLQRGFANLGTLDRVLRSAAGRPEGFADEDVSAQKDRDWARNLGAAVVITGTFGKVAGGLGISLAAAGVSVSDRVFIQANGLVPISDEISAASSGPLPVPREGTARGGVAGVTFPVCVSCPIPNYSHEARAAKYQGTVVLQIVVTPEGRVQNITIVKGQG